MLLAGLVLTFEDLQTEETVSGADEEGVHVSFSQLIAEQIGEGPDGFELQQLQRALNDEDRGTRSSLRDFSRSSRPTIRGYGMEVDTTDGPESESEKKERLVNNLQNLSVGERLKMLRGMPVSVAEKKELRRLTLQKDKPPPSSSKIPCCSQLKFYIIIAARHSWYSWLSFLHSLQPWQFLFKRIGGRFGTGVLSYFQFLKTLLLFNVFLFLVTFAFLVLPQAMHPTELPVGGRNFSGLELISGAGLFTDTVMYYGYYSNSTLQKSCAREHNASASTDHDCVSERPSYNMPLELYRFLIMDFIFTLLNTLFGELLWRLFSRNVLRRSRNPAFDIARNVLDLIYAQTLAWIGVLFSPLLPAVQILKLLLLFYVKVVTSVMMNCQVPRRPYRVSQMTTIFITLLCFPSFLGASVCVTYTMWSIKPSSSCGPFRGLRTMFQAGKRWVQELEKNNPDLSVLARVHAYLVENPFFLFVGAGIFLIVIYFYSQVVDGQRKVIELLQEHIEEEGAHKKYLISKLQNMHESKKRIPRRLRSQVSLMLCSCIFSAPFRARVHAHKNQNKRFEL
uniref:Transmembrane channel-like protein n=1 Tax=Oryzias latipes TaxID=8090 RepID=A0A3P9IT95_ORYLA